MLKTFFKINLITLLLICLLLPVNILAIQAEQGGQTEINQISDEIKDKQKQIDELYDKIDSYQNSLEQARSQSNSLKNQVYILETQIQKKQAEINLNEQEISQTNLEIKKTKQEIEQNQLDTEDKKNKLSSFLRQIYRSDQKDLLEILLLNNSLSDFFNQIEKIESIQSELNNNLINLKQLKSELEQEQKTLEQKKERLNQLNNELVGKKDNLESQQSVKASLLSQTKNSESRYQNLVNELKLEQKRINAEIVSLEKALRAKLTGDQTKLNQLGESNFDWPVPNHYITASFHDPDYPFRHIFEHPGIDIRAGQGTPLRASASGYVAKVKNGGQYGYSYIMLIHSNGFSTVYGHVSAIYVKTDQFVTQGEVIGATGGMPGTAGAGRLTTGPHLHFELRKDGIPINPADYLP